MKRAADGSLSTRTEATAGVLRRMLEAGELGEPLPPERQLAQLFGISRVTLRRAMAQLETQRVVRREHGRGTFAEVGPAMATIQSLAREPQPVLAVLVQQDGPRFKSQLTPWTWRICRALDAVSSPTRPKLRLVHDESFLTAVAQGKLTERQIEGFIACTHKWNSDQYERARQCRLPWVGLGRTSMSMVWNILDPDWTDALRQGIDALEPQPDDHVFIPSPPYPPEIDQQRWLRTAMLALDGYRIPADQITIQAEGPGESHGYLAMRGYLRQQHRRPTIVLGPFDLAVVGAYRALQSDGLTDLADIRFLGTADLEICQYMTPTLSSLSLDYERIAHKVLEMCAAQRDRGHPSALHEEPAQFIRRASTPLANRQLQEVSL